MSRYAYVNGRFVPHGEAMVHVEDRGFQFADGVYEVVTIIGGKLVDERGHLDRLARSLGELRIAWPVAPHVLKLLMRRLIAQNRVRQGTIYLQVTRGVAPRDFKFPKHSDSTLVMTTKRATSFATPEQLENGVKVISIPDIRWLRRDIKSVALLPQVLGKQRAVEAGAFEAWQLDPEGNVTEGCSSNAWIVTETGTLVTRCANNLILNGVTRLSIIRLAKEAGIPFEERAFSLEEAYRAREAFVSSASTFVMPVTRIDDHTVGNGRPGSFGERLRQAYLDYASGEGAS
ncbi:D-amino acid aminotransferase [Skermanella stibiiresistens SB22]|uniref:Probable branched-chain-amino-acid aminotransferase n=1 Tax=Skermanella stibiiresistens SB22 TaxID=1385369 RepID=W9HEE6_9PROT|nr:D-amino-acid transaminase [Skermanella stibiiresistens]EWY42263.1 D-amino acid aminotransferase [Skermanella stibiiresistens SB22]